MDSTLSFYTQKDPLVPLPERSPILEAGLHPRNEDYAAFSPNYLPTSDEEKKGRLVAARNSLELLSSILNSEQEPKPLKVSLFKLKKSLLSNICHGELLWRVFGSPPYLPF